MTRVVMHEAMLRYQCNLKGCCCKGWGIVFEADDLVRLLKVITDNDLRVELIGNCTIKVDDDGTIQQFRMQNMENDRTCHYLAGDGTCGLHATYGVGVLPRLCREFPAHAQHAGDEVSVHFDAVCPAVLDQLDESDGPFEVIELEPEPGSELELRSKRYLPLPHIAIGELPLTYIDLVAIREVVITAFNTRRESAIDVLARVNHALADLAATVSFILNNEISTDRFDAYLDMCVGLHDPRMLAVFFKSYERFIWSIDLSEVDWETLAEHLAPDPGWREVFDPRDPAWDPFLRRYLAHRFFSGFDRSPSMQDLGFTYGTINHSLATTFRLVVGLSRWLGRPVDRALLKVAVGATEYLYRSVRIPPSAMPWFGLDAQDHHGSARSMMTPKVEADAEPPATE